MLSPRPGRKHPPSPRAPAPHKVGCRGQGILTAKEGCRGSTKPRPGIKCIGTARGVNEQVQPKPQRRLHAGLRAGAPVASAIFPARGSPLRLRG